MKRSPTPKLGDLLPKVCGNVCVNSLGVLTVPEIDLKRESFENEYFAFDGEKLMASCVSSRPFLLLDIVLYIAVSTLASRLDVYVYINVIVLFGTSSRSLTD